MRTLEQGFLKARYAPMMKFCIHWCNHGLDWQTRQWYPMMGLADTVTREGVLTANVTGGDPAFACPARIDTAQFDRAVVIDVHEHLDDMLQFTGEVSRVTRIGGQVICTAPNGDENKLAVRLKQKLGMTPDEYGHVRLGLTIPRLAQLMEQCGIQIQQTSSFSKLFTELLELSINFAYVKILAPQSKVPVDKGQIAPATRDQLRSMKKSYRVYSLIYPVYWLISRLDALLPFSEGYVVVVAGRRTGS